MSANDLYLTTEEDLTTVAEAIRTRGGTSAALTYPNGFASAIAAIPGNVEVQEKDVNFYDYDGTLLYSYTKAQALALSALPENPSHEGLTAQGWNWTLAEIQAELTTYPNQFIQVGQNYITTSGKTEVDIVLDDNNYLSPCIKILLSGTATIEWGDGTTTTITGSSMDSSYYTNNHTYASTGEYTIKISVVGEMGFRGDVSSGVPSFIVAKNDNYARREQEYTRCTRHIRIGNNFTIDQAAFACMYNLETITIPNTVKYTTKNSGGNEFSYCRCLKCVIFPSTSDITSLRSYMFLRSLVKIVSMTKKMTSIESGSFQYEYVIEKIGIPSSVTEIKSYAFQEARSLEKIYLPAVGSIGSYCFQQCDNLQEFSAPNITEDLKTYTFDGCIRLKHIAFLSTTTTIKSYVCRNCKSLESITIPNTVTTIESYAINSCYSLKTVTIPATVTSIAGNAFQYNYSVEEYHVLPTTPPTMGTQVFGAASQPKVIYVPAASLETYKAASGWSTYASKIEAEPT